MKNRQASVLLAGAAIALMAVEGRAADLTLGVAAEPSAIDPHYHNLGPNNETRRHIFVRISRWKYVQLSARDFQNEYQFAQYYADLVKARDENT